MEGPVWAQKLRPYQSPLQTQSSLAAHAHCYKQIIGTYGNALDGCVMGEVFDPHKAPPPSPLPL